MSKAAKKNVAKGTKKASGARAQPNQEPVIEPEATAAPEVAESQPQEPTPTVELVPEVAVETVPEAAPVIEAAPVTELATEQASPSAPTEAAPTEAPQATEPPKEKKPRGRFAAMSIQDLQALYLEKVGRASGSEHRGYLIWKIREAEMGRITVGPVQARTSTGEPKDMQVLPLTLERTVVEKLDAAWRSKGIKSRMEFLRRAIGTYLTSLGATEEAALFAAE